MLSKRCTKCGDIKEVHLFSKVRSGRGSWCKACMAANATEWRRSNRERSLASTKAWREANIERSRASVKAWHQSPKGWARFAAGNAAKRAIKAGVPFSIDGAYLMAMANRTLNCPSCNRSLAYGGEMNAPQNASVDRVVSDLGYVPGNVAILCFRCNSIKRDASWSELLQVACWLKGAFR